MNLTFVEESRKKSLRARLQTLYDETQDNSIRELARQIDPNHLNEIWDLLNTRLMENFKNHGNTLAFSLIYELNYKNFTSTIYSQIRKCYALLDSADILQEVFFNIYRYPCRFKAQRPESFRHWTYSIIRHAIIKHLKNQARVNRIELAGETLTATVDPDSPTPLGRAITQESEDEYSLAFLFLLNLYLNQYRQLSPRERRALYLVEVRENSYKQAAEEMGTKLENLKMLIFRARKKVFRLMNESFGSSQSAIEEEEVEV